MSAPYMKCLIREQIDRAQSLKDAIPGHPGHESLERLAAVCRDTLEEQLRLLGQADALLDGGDGARNAEALEAVKHCTRAISGIEGFGMPPLHCRSEQAMFLNDVLSAMHAEAGLPFPCPAASCTSNDYYFTHPSTNTVHAPFLEAEFLLHMPDFYHELGHLLLARSRQAGLRPVLACMVDAIGYIDGYYQKHAGRAGQVSASAPMQDGVRWMWSRWKRRWIQEAFCDLFALFAAGPAYAYSNLHLVSKMNADMYELNLLSNQDHPSGEAKMRLLDAGMRILGQRREAERVKEEWDKIAQFCGDPSPSYAYAFPSGLLRDIAASVLPAFGQSGLRGYADGKAGPGGAGEATVAAILNDAWRGFWHDEGCGFRDLEKALISKLGGMVRGTAT